MADSDPPTSKLSETCRNHYDSGNEQPLGRDLRST
jgi:hypothetical protein